MVVPGILELEGTLETVLSHSLNLQAEVRILGTFSVPDSGLALETERGVGYYPNVRVCPVW